MDPGVSNSGPLPEYYLKQVLFQNYLSSHELFLSKLKVPVLNQGLNKSFLDHSPRRIHAAVYIAFI